MTSKPADVAKCLTDIEKLYADLLVQAIHKANDRDLPGGDAMVALAGVGSPEQWSELVAAAEFWHLAKCPRLDHTRCRYAEHLEDEDGEPILQTLLFWSEQWRAEVGYHLERRPSVASEANFIRWRLDWAWENLPEWDDFATDLNDAKARLENLLYAGERAEKGAPCLYDECKGARVQRKHEPYRDAETGQRRWRLSDWYCRKCKRSWTDTKYRRIVIAAEWAAQSEVINDETWCSTRYASNSVGRPESTVRAWVSTTKEAARPVDVRYPIATACVIAGRRVGFVLLADVQRRDAYAKRRKHAA